MNKLKTFAILSVALFALASCFGGSEAQKEGTGSVNNEVTSNTGTTTKEEPTKEPAKPIAETILLVVRENDPVITDDIVKSLQEIGKQLNQTMVRVSPEDERVKKIVEKLGDNMYYPLFVLSTDSPNIQFDKLDKNFIVEDTEKKLFTLKEPAIAGFPKLTMNQKAETKALLSKYAQPIQAKDSKAKILLVEDPLCPACSAAYYDKTIQDNLKDFTQEALYFPLPSHKNSPKLVGILQANQNHYELLGVMLKADNLNTLSALPEDKVYEKVVELAKAAGINEVKDGEKLSEEKIKELQTLALNLGLAGTPSFYVVTDKEYIPVTTFDMLKQFK